MPSFDLAVLRAEFPILSRSVYMISNSLGAMPRGAAAALAEYAETWATRGVRAWAERWWGMGVEVGNRVARLIGAAPGSVSMHENVTTAHAVVLSTLAPPGPGRGARRRIVCTEGDFPSTIYLCRAQEALGFELVLVPAEPDLSVDVQRVVDAIDERTALVAVSHVLFRSAFILDPAPIVERAHARGCARGARHVPVGGHRAARRRGARRRLRDRRLPEVALRRPGQRVPLHAARPAGLARAAPDGLVLAPASRSRSARTTSRRCPTRVRMMNGTPSIPAWHAAIAGLDILAEVGIDQIRARSQAHDGAAPRPRRRARLPHGGPARSRSGSAAPWPSTCPTASPWRAPSTRATSSWTTGRGAGIRVSPHFYNTEEEVDAVVAEMHRIVETRDYVESGPSGTVT